MFTAAPVAAQTPGVFTERPQAALSRNLRSLAASPKSVTALMGAGRAALDLGDAQAALTFFARAEEQTPRDGRVKMWIANALVQLQQPHAALKFFHDAAELGVPAADLARDRGLAHDIAGNPREAQRDYRMALQRGRDDEATRRLALSLAISGEREPALRLLEDQLLVRDRSAERARALVLALTGDSAGAARAVQAAMPGPQAGAMRPFLARLPSLSPAERALAVHLGIFPQDGRTAPPSTYAANDFANAVTDAGRPDPSQNSLARRSSRPEPISTEPRRRPGTEGGLAPAIRRTTATFRPSAKSDGEEALAGVRQREAPKRPSASPGFSGSNPHWALARGLDPSPPRRKPESQPKPERTPPAPAPAETAVAVNFVPPPATVLQETSPPPVATSPSTPLPQFQLQPGSQPTEVMTAAVEPSKPPPQTEPQSRPADVRVAAVEPSTPPPQAEPRSSPAEVQIAEAPSSAPPPQAEGAPTGSRLADLSATIADIAEPEPPAARTTAKPKPAAAAAAKKPKPAAPAEPSRIWVQIAGGAARTALPREFVRLKAKAPKTLGARSAWTTPLNATNRLLVGPFASSREAQAFVNQLKAEDLSGFAWTSAAGQKIEKLSAK
ncbi:MAG TPA: SPOR domain-containing protein [Allosphingosinicella sp.]|nr:SPOR domain-containing protein [Allosphingosinicella sp.]